jgi:hypothetical protein
MPLYLVRWPRLEAALVLANDEDHLADILDEMDTPTAASWTEYRGPVWIDINLGIEAKAQGNGHAWAVQNVEEAAKEPTFGATLHIADTDTGFEMMDAICAGAFPHLAKVREEGDLDNLDPSLVRSAALKDLESHEPSGVLPTNVRGEPEKDD